MPKKILATGASSIKESDLCQLNFTYSGTEISLFFFNRCDNERDWLC